MLKRPKRGETEEDLLAEQEQFLNDPKKDIGVFVVKKNKLDNKNIQSTKVEEEKASENVANVLSEIVEKNLHLKQFEFRFAGDKDALGGGFPSVLKCQPFERKSRKGGSLFLQNLKKQTDIPQTVAIACPSDEDSKLSDPDTQNLDKLKREIHEENLHKIKEMSDQEILEEQAKLLKVLDPKFIEFMKKRKNPDHINMEENIANKNDAAKTSSDLKLGENVLADHFSDLKNSTFLHMDVVEPEKFAWMSQIPETSGVAKSETVSLSPRFDFDGCLLNPDIGIPVYYGLHHHGNEEHLPGYTVEELIPLCRSMLLAQKLVAYRILAKITSLAKQGYYENLPDLLPKIINFDISVILRYGLDDTNESVIQAACGLLAAMLLQPDDKKFVYLYENDVDLSDDEFCRVDIISGLLRMNLLERLRYVLEVLQPVSLSLVQNIFEVLLEISRHSKSASTEIFKCDRLIFVIRDYVLDKIKFESKNEHIRITVVKLIKQLCKNDSPIAQQLVKNYDLFQLVEFFKEHKM